jgi:D-lactate dehydrogenase (cytochrome)
VTCRIEARTPTSGPAPDIEHDETLVSSFLSDAAHVPGGFASGVVFPTSESEVAAIVAASARVLPIGAQSSLTGGATPRGELLLSTRALTSMDMPDGDHVHVGAGVPLVRLQQYLAGRGLYYPPVPTFDGAYVGGTIATNAAGAATFKYGSTRRWVDAITVVLASGAMLDFRRGQVTASPEGTIEIRMPGARQIEVAIPRYSMPAVPKLSAGYHAAPEMDLIDLFIGSEGTLGIVTNALLRVIPRPGRAVALITCRDDRQAIAVTRALRDAAQLAWVGRGMLDVSAIEYIDERSLQAVPDVAFIRSGVQRPAAGEVMLLVQIEMTHDEPAVLGILAGLLDATGVTSDPIVTAAGDDRSAQRLFDLREAVPSAINAAIALAKQREPNIEKTAGDFIVPFDRLEEALSMYRSALEKCALDYAIWGHVSDGNLHVNVVPRTLTDMMTGREALIDIAREVIRMGGSPLAEHGVGRSAMKQHLLRELYGEDGIEQMRAVKRALDPDWKLSPGVLFPAAGEQQTGGGTPKHV